jgi:hypothetical protein
VYSVNERDSPDRLVVGAHKGLLQVFDVRTGECLHILELGKGRAVARLCVFIADGRVKLLARWRNDVVRGDESFDLRVYDLGDDPTRVMLRSAVKR